MNNEFDDTDLRAALGHHAELAPPEGGLLTAVHRRSRRKAQRRVAVTGGLAAVAVAASVLAVQNMAPGGGGVAADVGASSSGSAAPKPPVQLPKDPRLDFRFPYAPGWTPDDFGNEYGAVINEGLVRLGYLDEPGRENEDGPGLVVDLYDERPENWPGDGEDTDVRGTTGIYAPAADDGGDDVLAWEENGKFLMLRTRHIDRADMVRFADGLEEGEGPGFLASSCGDGGRTSYPTGEMVTGHSLIEDEDRYYMWTMVEAKGYAVTPDGPTLTVDLGDRDAVIATDQETGDRVLVATIDAQQVVAVHADLDYSITDDQLVYEALDLFLSGYPCD